MKILFFGDIFGRPGRDAVRIILPELQAQHKPDFVIGNIENLAHGRGITNATLNELEELGGFHAYTGGNHIWEKSDATDILQKGALPVVRPANYEREFPGAGARVVTSGAQRLLVINVLGRVFMKAHEELTDPFAALDAILADYTLDKEETDKEYVNGIFIDVHAEATSEKRALGFYVDGRVSGLVGTHTHVPTRDEQILPKGTAYITDVGMVGPFDSSLGIAVEGIIQEFLTGVKHKKEVSENNKVEVGAVVIETNADGLAKNIEHIRTIVDIG